MGAASLSDRSTLNCRQLIEDDKNHSDFDVTYWLIDDARKNGFIEADWNWLSGDAVLAILAGR